MWIIKSASAAFLFFLILFLNKQERQAAIRALSVIGSHRGTTGRALALFGQFVRSRSSGWISLKYSATRSCALSRSP